MQFFLLQKLSKVHHFPNIPPILAGTSTKYMSSTSNRFQQGFKTGQNQAVGPFELSTDLSSNLLYPLNSHLVRARFVSFVWPIGQTRALVNWTGHWPGWWKWEKLNPWHITSCSKSLHLAMLFVYDQSYMELCTCFFSYLVWSYMKTISTFLSIKLKENYQVQRILQLRPQTLWPFYNTPNIRLEIILILLSSLIKSIENFNFLLAIRFFFFW